MSSFPQLSDMKIIGASSSYLRYYKDNDYNVEDQRVGISNEYKLVVKKISKNSYYSSKYGHRNSYTYYTGYADVICIAFKK